ncbi:MAG: AHH domain-containing protein [Actinomycetota bacterium]
MLEPTNVTRHSSKRRVPSRLLVAAMMVLSVLVIAPAGASAQKVRIGEGCTRNGAISTGRTWWTSGTTKKHEIKFQVTCGFNTGDLRTENRTKTVSTYRRYRYSQFCDDRVIAGSITLVQVRPPFLGGTTSETRRFSFLAAACVRDGEQATGLGGNPTVLRHNMSSAARRRLTGLSAHHIVPSSGRTSYAALARAQLRRCRIDINSSANGILVSASYNSQMNAGDYERYLYNRIRGGNCFGTLSHMRGQINRGGKFWL